MHHWKGGVGQTIAAAPTLTLAHKDHAADTSASGCLPPHVQPYMSPILDFGNKFSPSFEVAFMSPSSAEYLFVSFSPSIGKLEQLGILEYLYKFLRCLRDSNSQEILSNRNLSRRGLRGEALQ